MRYIIFFITLTSFLICHILANNNYQDFYNNLCSTIFFLVLSSILSFHISKLIKKNWMAILFQLIFILGLFFPFYKLSNSYFYTKNTCSWGIILAICFADFYVLRFIHGKEIFGKIIFISILKSFAISITSSIPIAFIINTIYRQFNESNSSWISFHLFDFFIFSFEFFFFLLFVFFSVKKGKKQKENKTDENSINENISAFEVGVFSILFVFILLSYIFIIVTFFSEKTFSLDIFLNITISGFVISHFLLKKAKGETSNFIFTYGVFFITPIYLVQIFLFAKKVIEFGFSTSQMVALYFYIAVFIFLILSSIKKGKYSDFIIPIIFVLLLISTCTPLNFHRLAVRNHLYRIEKIYEKHNLLHKTENLIYFETEKASEILSDKEKQQIKDDFEYFNWNAFSWTNYPSFFKDSFLTITKEEYENDDWGYKVQKPNGETIFCKSRPALFQQLLGFPYP